MQVYKWILMFIVFALQFNLIRMSAGYGLSEI